MPSFAPSCGAVVKVALLGPLRRYKKTAYAAFERNSVRCRWEATGIGHPLHPKGCLSDTSLRLCFLFLPANDKPFPGEKPKPRAVETGTPYGGDLLPPCRDALPTMRRRVFSDGKSGNKGGIFPINIHSLCKTNEKKRAPPRSESRNRPNRNLFCPKRVSPKGCFPCICPPEPLFCHTSANSYRNLTFLAMKDLFSS